MLTIKIFLDKRRITTGETYPLNFRIYHLRHFIKAAYKVDYGDWHSEGIEMVQQLDDYINRMLSVPEPIKIRLSIWFRRDVIPAVINALLIIPVGVGFGIYYLFKSIRGSSVKSITGSRNHFNELLRQESLADSCLNYLIIMRQILRFYKTT